jgi:hypothetical protein
MWVKFFQQALVDFKVQVAFTLVRYPGFKIELVVQGFRKVIVD